MRPILVEAPGRLGWRAVRLRHFVLTNFNVALPGVDVDRHGAPVRTPEWLAERCELFERYCLPSVRRQSCGDFDWLVRWEPPPDAALAARIAGYAEAAPLRLVDAAISFRRAVEAALAPGDEVVLTTRLDNDDALHRDALARVRAAALAASPELRFLDLPVGYLLDSASGELRRLEWRSYHFLSLVEPRAGGAVRTVRRIDHTRAAELAPVASVTDEPMWLEVVHGRNRSNAVRGEPAGGVDLAALFGVGLPSR
jgi:hypothetical protein